MKYISKYNVEVSAYNVKVSAYKYDFKIYPNNEKGTA